VKQANCLITMAAVAGVVLANAGVLQAVHLHQHRVWDSASNTSGPGGTNHSGSHHDPSTCPFCTQLASSKTVPFCFPEHISLTIGPAEEVVLCRSFLPPSVFPSLLSARAPPSTCS
jgi:hypothetical protein